MATKGCWTNEMVEEKSSATIRIETIAKMTITML